VGGNEPVPLDVRLLTATNRDLKRHVQSGAFREDLYYRLNVVTITVPPLRERRQDVPVLAEHFLGKYAGAAGKRVAAFARETLALLSAYTWPGNVRELEHVVERAVALASSELVLPDDLSDEVRGLAPRPPASVPDGMTLEDLKRWYVAKVLDETAGNKVRAAEILGIDRRTLYRILERQTLPEDADL
jgi:two-component system response regulator AtoC